MSAMPRKLPLHVTREKSRHGKIKFFYRVGKGERIRLPDDVSSPEFKEAYRLAVSGHKPVPLKPTETPSHSLLWLVEQYKQSSIWKSYSIATRKQRENIFLNTLKRSSNAPYKAINRRSLELAIEDRADTPAQANNFLKAMRGLFEWATKNEFVDINPTIGIGKLKYKSDGFAAWTVDDLIVFYQKWPIGTKPRLAAELILQSGLRRSDIVCAGKQHLKDGIFSIRTQKTGATITVQFPESLITIIDATPTGDLAFITNEHGKPFTKESFGNWFREKCTDAGIEKSAHGIRKLSATLAAEGGAPAHELMAQYGWTNIAQAEIYTKGADRKALGIKSSNRIKEQMANKLPAPKPKVRD